MTALRSDPFLLIRSLGKGRGLLLKYIPVEEERDEVVEDGGLARPSSLSCSPSPGELLQQRSSGLFSIASLLITIAAGMEVGKVGAPLLLTI
jgi:hypothetical protein